MIGTLLRWLVGGVDAIAAPLERAYRARLDAANDQERIEADLLIKRLEGARAIAVIEAQDRTSATRIGRLLIVVPYGLWWSAIFAVSIINPLFGLRLEIHDIPPDIKSMALVLIPAILLGDVARGGLAMLRR